MSFDVENTDNTESQKRSIKNNDNRNALDKKSNDEYVSNKTIETGQKTKEYS
jgi:hypothetical protein